MKFEISVGYNNIIEKTDNNYGILYLGDYNSILATENKVKIILEGKTKFYGTLEELKIQLEK
jgi:hypothetical protein